MSSFFRLVLIVSLLCVFSSQTFAAEETNDDSAMSKSLLKVTSGVANVATGWLELPKNISLVGQYQPAPASGAAAVSLGVLQGAWYMVNRMGCGMFDLLTFMFPSQPSVDPAFVWNDFSRESKFMGNR